MIKEYSSKEIMDIIGNLKDEYEIRSMSTYSTKREYKKEYKYVLAELTNKNRFGLIYKDDDLVSFFAPVESKRNKQVFITCPMCGKEHVHGFTNGLEGYKAPHCKYYNGKLSYYILDDEFHFNTLLLKDEVLDRDKPWTDAVYLESQNNENNGEIVVITGYNGFMHKLFDKSVRYGR